jgi:hypothetical protein
MDKMITIGRVVRGYYDQLTAKDLTKHDFDLWIDSLSDPIRSHFKAKGLDGCRDVLNFQRFILETQDRELSEYLKERLTEEDFNYWTAHNKP